MTGKTDIETTETLERMTSDKEDDGYYPPVAPLVVSFDKSSSLGSVAPIYTHHKFAADHDLSGKLTYTPTDKLKERIGDRFKPIILNYQAVNRLYEGSTIDSIVARVIREGTDDEDRKSLYSHYGKPHHEALNSSGLVNVIRSLRGRGVCPDTLIVPAEQEAEAMNACLTEYPVYSQTDSSGVGQVFVGQNVVVIQRYIKQVVVLQELTEDGGINSKNTYYVAECMEKVGAPGLLLTFTHDNRLISAGFMFNEFIARVKTT